MYIKINSNINYAEFFKLAREVKFFKSLKGKEYEVKNIEGSVMSFIRKSTEKQWSMDLEGVHRAYLELTDFKTENLDLMLIVGIRLPWVCCYI